MSIDLHDLLDTPLAGEPVPADPAARLAAARRAVTSRSRRHAAGAVLVAAGVVAALMVPAGLLRDGSGRSDGAASTPVSSATPVGPLVSPPSPSASVMDLGDLCPLGLPLLKIDFGDDRGDAAGAATAELALAALLPDTDLSGVSLPDDPADHLPVWVELDGRTYLVQIDGRVGNDDWHAFPATLRSCDAITASASPTAVAQLKKLRTSVRMSR